MLQHMIMAVAADGASKVLLLLLLVMLFMNEFAATANALLLAATNDLTSAGVAS
jgi:hypothetical protein